MRVFQKFNFEKNNGYFEFNFENGSFEKLLGAWLLASYTVTVQGRYTATVEDVMKTL